MHYVFNKAIVFESLKKFKKDNKISNVFFDISRYTTETPLNFVICKYTEKWVATKVYEADKILIFTLYDLMIIHQLPKSLLLITILKAEFNDKASVRLHYFATNIPIAN